MSRPSALDYQRYMQSGAWKARKAAYYQKHKRVCAGCEATTCIDLHHHTYIRLGRERDEDMVPVCEMCHRLIHRHHKVSGLDLTTATFAVLRLVAEYGQDGLLKRLKKLPVPEIDRGHVPRHLRTAEIDDKGRLRNRLTWREECHPWWTLPPHGEPKPKTKRGGPTVAGQPKPTEAGRKSRTKRKPVRVRTKFERCNPQPTVDADTRASFNVDGRIVIMDS